MPAGNSTPISHGLTASDQPDAEPLGMLIAVDTETRQPTCRHHRDRGRDMQANSILLGRDPPKRMGAAGSTSAASRA